MRMRVSLLFFPRPSGASGSGFFAAYPAVIERGKGKVFGDRRTPKSLVDGPPNASSCCGIRRRILIPRVLYKVKRRGD
jgi:hypothetical protein